VVGGVNHLRDHLRWRTGYPSSPPSGDRSWHERLERSTRIQDVDSCSSVGAIAEGRAFPLNHSLVSRHSSFSFHQHQHDPCLLMLEALPLQRVFS
jgi:hypothetical protein